MPDGYDWPEASTSASQTPLPQNPVAQSVFAAQSLPNAQVGPHEPPQSVSASSPFLIPSTQEMQTPPAHRALKQSLSAAQFFPAAHFVAQEPPQSTSVS